MTHYDLVLIGTGSGNTVIDERFDEWSVAIIEERTFGGTCLNRGCIPSKMFIYPAELLEDAGEGPRLGAHTRGDGADWPAIRERVFGRIDPNAEHGHQHREKQNNVDVLLGVAVFTGPHALRVDLRDGGQAEVTADRVVIAAGSRPVVPEIDGLDGLEADADYYTSDSVMRMPDLPGRIGIIGGGYIGVEFAHVFSAYGSGVVQVESDGSLLTDHDPDVARTFTEFARDAWDVRTETELTSLAKKETGIALRLKDRAGMSEEIEVDAILVAVGRVPNGDRLALEAAGIEVDDDGVVVVDEFQRTTADGVWALGDVSSHTPLKHAANQDARVVQHNLLRPDDLMRSDHDAVPSAVFSRPQIATVGLTEPEARHQGLDVSVATKEFGDVAYGWAMEDDRDDQPAHFVKLVADRGTGLLVGGHIIGPQASLLIQPLIIAISHQIPVRGYARSQYWIHPALSEVVEQALLALEDELNATEVS